MITQVDHRANGLRRRLAAAVRAHAQYNSGRSRAASAGMWGGVKPYATELARGGYK